MRDSNHNEGTDQHVVVIVVDFAGGSRAWTRQAPWYLPCGEAVCVVCHEFVACVCVWLCQWCVVMDEASALVLALWWSRVHCVPWVCSMCACITLRFLPKTAPYICYILLPQKGSEIALVRIPKATRLIIKCRSTSALAMHSTTLQSSLYIRLPTKLQYI